MLRNSGTLVIIIPTTVVIFMLDNIDMETHGSSEPDFLIMLTPFQKSSLHLILFMVIKRMYAEVLIL
ncbi:MAG: hypothetical protein HN612_02380 [Kordiimonadaceae bacterium]|nr:hypothetical protein [Kordiimonadaceae bacterium]